MDWHNDTENLLEENPHISYQCILPGDRLKPTKGGCDDFSTASNEVLSYSCYYQHGTHTAPFYSEYSKPFLLQASIMQSHTFTQGIPRSLDW